MNSLQASEHTHHGLNFAESSLLDDSSDNIKARLSMPLIFPKLRYLGLHQRMRWRANSRVHQSEGITTLFVEGATNANTDPTSISRPQHDKANSQISVSDVPEQHVHGQDQPTPGLSDVSDPPDEEPNLQDPAVVARLKQKRKEQWEKSSPDNQSTSIKTDCPFSGVFETFTEPPRVCLIPKTIGFRPEHLFIMKTGNKCIDPSANEVALSQPLGTALDAGIAALVPVKVFAADTKYRFAPLNDNQSTRMLTHRAVGATPVLEVNPKFAQFHAVFAIIRAVLTERYTAHHVDFIIVAWDAHWDQEFNSIPPHNSLFEQSIVDCILAYCTNCLEPSSPILSVLPRLSPASRNAYNREDVKDQAPNISHSVLLQSGAMLQRYQYMPVPSFVGNYLAPPTTGNRGGVTA